MNTDRQDPAATQTNPLDPESAADKVGAASRWKRTGYMVLGFAMLVLGLIGALLPVMPTTIFLILAAWFFGRSSPRLEAWLLNHPRFGPSLRQWREEGAIPRRIKIIACTGMAIGYGVFWFSVRPGTLLALIVALLIGASAVYVITRPEPGGQA